MDADGKPVDLADENVTSEALAAMLAVNPRYQAALRAAEAESWDGPGVEVSEVIAAADERRRAATDHATDGGTR